MAGFIADVSAFTFLP